MSELTVKLVCCHKSWFCASWDIVGHIGPFILCKDVVEEVFDSLVEVVGIMIFIGTGC
jgi:hypothetical protein